MICENCGKEIPVDAKFCQECGAMVSGEITTAENPEVKAEGGKNPDVPKEKKPRKKKGDLRSEQKGNREKSYEEHLSLPGRCLPLVL